jgi:hypothetical protein
MPARSPHQHQAATCKTEAKHACWKLEHKGSIFFFQPTVQLGDETSVRVELDGVARVSEKVTALREQGGGPELEPFFSDKI